MTGRRELLKSRFSRTIIFLFAFCLTTISATASARDLIVAPEEAPFFQLSNIRMESDRFGRSVLVVDYRRSRKGESDSGGVRIAGRTKAGELSVFGFTRFKESGDFRFSITGMMMGNNDYEVYLVLNTPTGHNYLVSNIVRLGNPGPATRARSFTAEEQKSADRGRLRLKPPTALPEGYLAATESTKLVPGMPVKAGSYGEWKDAEVIGFEVNGPVTLKYDDQKKLEAHPRDQWIAIDPGVLKKVEANPDLFKPSVETLPGSVLAIPDGAAPLAEEVDLPPGTPLFFDRHASWANVFLIKSSGDDITFRYKDFKAFPDETKPRSKFLIADSTLDEIPKSDTADKFAKNLVRDSLFGGFPSSSDSAFPSNGKSNGKSERPIHHSNYPIRIDIPENAKRVPDDLKVPKGTALAVCWGQRWCPLTTLSENEDGSLHVRWDERSDAWDRNLKRDQLIIEDKTVKQLRELEGELPAANGAPDTNSSDAIDSDELKLTLRTWTSSNGKFKVEATFVSQTGDTVTLKTDAGREISMPLEKLGEADQQLLKNVAADEDNPFE